MPQGIQPDSDKRPIVADGKYGMGGEAEGKSITLRTVPGAGNESLRYVNIEVQIDTPNQGRIFVHTQPFGAFNTQTGDGAASMVKNRLGELGLDWRTTTFADEPDEKGNFALVGPNPFPRKVVVDVGLDKFKSKGVEREQNYLKSIAFLG